MSTYEKHLKTEGIGQDLKRVGQYLKRIGKAVLGMELTDDEFASIIPSMAGGDFLDDKTLELLRDLRTAKTFSQVNTVIDKINASIDHFTPAEFKRLTQMLKNAEENVAKLDKQ